MKYIDPINKCEWSRNYNNENPPPEVLIVEENHPFFTGYNRATHYIKWPEAQLFAYTEGELLEISANKFKITLSPKQFIERFVIEELLGIYTNAESNVSVRIWLDRLTGAEYVDLEDLSLQEGMAYMVFQNLITQERHDQIMGLES